MVTKLNIFAVGSHPDDIELGCGGVIAKHLALDDQVFVLILTNGERGSHSPKKEECFESLLSLGVKKENIFFGNLLDGFLRDDMSTVTLIESYINKLNIARIYTHYPNDRHQDHRNCSLAVASAARKIPEIFLFQGPSTKVPFEPHYFIEISEHDFIKKINALNHYQSQIKKGIINLKAIESLARFHGSLNDTNYAEAFAINHLIRKNNDI